MWRIVRRHRRAAGRDSGPRLRAAAGPKATATATATPSRSMLVTGSTCRSTCTPGDIYSHAGPPTRCRGPARRRSGVVSVAVPGPRLLHLRQRRAGLIDQPASDLLFHCRADRIRSCDPLTPAVSSTFAVVRGRPFLKVNPHTERRRTEVNRPGRGPMVVKMVVKPMHPLACMGPWPRHRAGRSA
jgi:hypothetical protein